MKNSHKTSISKLALACSIACAATSGFAQGMDPTKALYGEDEARVGRINATQKNQADLAANECIGVRCKEGPGTAGWNEGRQCFAAMQAWEGVGGSALFVDRALTLRPVPDYDCYKAAVLNRRLGNYSMNWSAPSQAEYRAWALAYTEFPSSIPAWGRVRELARTKPGDGLVGDAFQVWLIRSAAKYNEGLLGKGLAYLRAANPMLGGLPGGSGRETGQGAGEDLAVVCSKDQFDSTRGIVNKLVRDLALKRLNAECAGAAEKIAAGKAAEAAAAAKAAAYRLPTNADLKSMEKVDTTTNAELQSFFAQAGLPSRTVGASDAPARLQVLLDFGDWRSRLLLLRVWPAVVDGQLSLQIVPTSLVSDRIDQNAAFWATPKPFEFIQNWLTKRLDIAEHQVGVQLLEVQTASTAATDAQLVSARGAVVKANEFVEQSTINWLPRMAVTGGINGAQPVESAGQWSTASTDNMLATVGIKAPRIYSKEQVKFLTGQFYSATRGVVTLAYAPDEPDTPSRLPELRADARDLCSSDKVECWKVPVAAGGTAGRGEDSAGMKFLKGAAWVLFNKN